MQISLPVRRAVHIGAVALGGLVLSAPLLYLVSASLMTSTEIRSFPPQLVPASPEWGNYAQALDYLQLRTVLNSFIFSLGVVALQLAVTMPAGFALAKLRFRGGGLIAGAFVATMFIPGIVTLVPAFLVTRELQLLNSYGGLILPVAAQTAFGTLLFRQFYVGLPDELIEAARLDGAGWWQIFRRIGVPLARPATAAYAAVTYLAAWNLYIWPLVVATDPDLRVLPLALATLAQTSFSFVPPNVSMAAIVFSTIPALAVFLGAQRWFMRGLTGSGVE